MAEQKKLKSLQALGVMEGGHVADVTYHGEDFLKLIQEWVGGYVEVVNMGVPPGLPPGVVVLANEDGMTLGLRPTRCGLLGPFLVVGTTADGSELASLTQAEETAVRFWLDLHRDVRHPCAPPL